MRKALGGFLLLLAVYQGAWCLLWLATHVWAGDWFIRVNVFGDAIAAACCGVVGWHLIRARERASRRPPPSPAGADTAVTAP